MNLISRFALPGALALTLAACAADDETGLEPLVCPVVGVLADASVLHTGAYDLEFMRANLMECALNEGEMTAQIRFEARAKIGPGATANDFTYPYFVALLNPDGEVVSKVVRTAEVNFKSGKTEAFFAEEYDDIKFTVPEGKDGLGYEILTGFQLTREQAEYNRAQHAKPDPAQAPAVTAQ